MSYIGQNLPTDVFGGYTTDTFAGDGSATTFTLSQAPFNEQGLIVVINNVIQQPTTNYTVSGTTLTIVGTAVASGDVIYARHTGVALPIGEANALDLQGQSDKLILDADADTTISADTDDQIDFKAGGTDIMSLTATTAQINDGLTVTVADNTDNLTLTSTDADANAGPNLRLYRNSSSPADHDIVGQIDFEGRNDNSEDIVYAKIFGSPKDVSDGTEDGGFFLHTMLAGSDVSRMGMSSSQTVFNDDSNDLDFRVESNGKANMLFVDGGNDRVNMGASTDVAATLVVSDGDSGQASPTANANTFVIEKNDNCGMTILAATDAYASLHFGDSGDADIGQVRYQHTDNNMVFIANASEAMRINSSGRLLIGHTSVDLQSVVSVRVSTDDALITADNAKSDVSGYMIRSAADRGATLYYAFYDALSGNAADREFYVRGDGNVYADGSFSGSGADYAEFFESKTGNAIAVGTTVVLEDNKVRASTDSDEASSIIGVVRPKSDTMIKASMVIGNCAWNHWSGKYLTDDYDSFITEEFTITEWTETTYEDGNPRTEEVWYETDKIPSDVTVPTEDVKDSDGRVIKTKAVVKTTEADGVNKLIRKKENSSFDKSKEYSPREKRDEWIIVGLLGQVPINKGQKTGDRWIKMKNKSDTVEEWYIR